MSWGGEAGDVHVTNVWSHGFINTYDFKHASKTRLEGLCRHFDSLDHVVYYKITRDATGETLYEVTKENEFARRYFDGVRDALEQIERAANSSRRRNKISGGTADIDKRTVGRSSRGSKKKSEASE